MVIQKQDGYQVFDILTDAEAYVNAINEHPVFPITYNGQVVIERWYTLPPIDTIDGKFAVPKPSDELLLFHLLGGKDASFYDDPQDYADAIAPFLAEMATFRATYVDGKSTHEQTITRKPEQEV